MAIHIGAKPAVDPLLDGEYAEENGTIVDQALKYESVTCWYARGDITIKSNKRKTERQRDKERVRNG